MHECAEKLEGCQYLALAAAAASVRDKVPCGLVEVHVRGEGADVHQPLQQGIRLPPKQEGITLHCEEHSLQDSSNLWAPAYSPTCLQLKQGRAALADFEGKECIWRMAGVSSVAKEALVGGHLPEASPSQQDGISNIG